MEITNNKIDTHSFFLIKILGVLFIIQIIRIISVKVLFLFVEKTSSNNILINMIFMIVFSILMIVCIKNHGNKVSFIQNISNNKIIYFCITSIVIFLIVSTPVFTKDYARSAIISLVYSTLIIPIFEELLFRGCIWNQLKMKYKNEVIVYIITTLIFAVWHFGYIDSIMLNMEIYNLTGNLLFVMLMKVLIGLVFGIIIGFVRYKTKNTYSAILMHSAINVFGR
jgi:uncharacterized protein